MNRATNAIVSLCCIIRLELYYISIWVNGRKVPELERTCFSADCSTDTAIHTFNTSAR